jgi:hypothetical protein
MSAAERRDREGNFVWRLEERPLPEIRPWSRTDAGSERS